MTWSDVVDVALWLPLNYWNKIKLECLNSISKRKWDRILCFVFIFFFYCMWFIALFSHTWLSFRELYFSFFLGNKSQSRGTPHIHTHTRKKNSWIELLQKLIWCRLMFWLCTVCFTFIFGWILIYHVHCLIHDFIFLFNAHFNVWVQTHNK